MPKVGQACGVVGCVNLKPRHRLVDGHCGQVPIDLAIDTKKSQPLSATLATTDVAVVVYRYDLFSDLLPRGWERGLTALFRQAPSPPPLALLQEAAAWQQANDLFGWLAAKSHRSRQQPRLLLRRTEPANDPAGLGLAASTSHFMDPGSGHGMVLLGLGAAAMG